MDFEVAYYRMKKNAHFANQVEISDELFEELSKYMNPNYSVTEQIIYYYIMICKTLTYDPLFYAAEQKGIPAMLHEDPACVKLVTPSNNEVVCYETAAIFEKILERYGLEYEVLKSNPQIYGQEHTGTKFIVDKFIVCADVLSHAFINDSFYSKVGIPLQSIKCINQCEESREEFDVMVQNVYKDVNNKTLSPNMEKLRTILMLSKKNMTYDDRVKMLINLGFVGKNLPMMDRFAILKYMYLTSFSVSEMTNNLRMVMVKQRIEDDDDKVTEYPAAWFAINPISLEKHPELSVYCGYDKDFNFMFASREKLQAEFDYGCFDYLTYFDQSKKIGNYAKLPGINKATRNY